MSIIIRYKDEMAFKVKAFTLFVAPTTLCVTQFTHLVMSIIDLRIRESDPKTVDTFKAKLNGHLGWGTLAMFVAIKLTEYDVKMPFTLESQAVIGVCMAYLFY